MLQRQIFTEATIREYRTKYTSNLDEFIHHGSELVTELPTSKVPLDSWIDYRGGPSLGLMKQEKWSYCKDETA
jgi:hypothetical protein